MKVKVCGLTNIIDAQTAIDCGTDKLGFVMGGWVQPAEIEPHAQKVREIIRSVPSHVTSCIVTHLLEPQDILDLANYVGATGIKISEDIGLEKREGQSCT